MKSFDKLTPPSIQVSRRKNDPYVTHLAEWIEPLQQDKKYDLGLLGIPLSKSSISFSGAHLHPRSFRQLLPSFSTYQWDEDLDLQDLKVADFGDVQTHVTDILETHQYIEDTAAQIVEQYPSMVLCSIGGDHSITAPLLKGIYKHSSKRIGVIQFDAHLDVRDIAYGGPSNGTPIRQLIDSDTIPGDQIYTFGIRNFANSKWYRSYAEERGMHVFSQSQVKQEGLDLLLSEAMKQLDASCDAIYVTVDIDVLDQCIVPGVPAIGPNGLGIQELLQAIQTLGRWPKVLGLDLVCVDPTVDFRDVTSRVALHVFLHFATGYYQQKILGS